jgi:hypothetical protein
MTNRRTVFSGIAGAIATLATALGVRSALASPDFCTGRCVAAVASPSTGYLYYNDPEYGWLPARTCHPGQLNLVLDGAEAGTIQVQGMDCTWQTNERLTRLYQETAA